MSEASCEPGTDEQERAYQRARDLLGAVIAEYSAKIGDADDAGDDATADRLVEERRPYVEQRQRLTFAGRAEVDRIIAEYPDVVKQLRGAGS